MTDREIDKANIEATKNRRYGWLNQHLNVTNLNGLEIGALTRPVVCQSNLSKQGSISYLDHLPTEALVKKYADDPDVVTEEILPVSYVCPEGDLPAAVGETQFDYVVAAHVVEHVPNLISWLSMLESILQPGGSIFLVIPDKRFTFDYRRPVTTPGKYISAYLKQVTKPELSDIYDHISLSTKMRGDLIWAGLHDDDKLEYVNNSSEALKITGQVFEKDLYIDTHVGVFTPSSFITILQHIIANKFVQLEVTAFEDTNQNEIEFFILLRKRPAEFTSDNVWHASCLNSIPRLNEDRLQVFHNKMIRNMAESVHQIATNYNNQEHRLNILQAELEQTRKQKIELENRKLFSGLVRHVVRWVRHRQNLAHQSKKTP